MSWDSFRGILRNPQSLAPRDDLTAPNSQYLPHLDLHQPLLSPTFTFDLPVIHYGQDPAPLPPCLHRHHHSHNLRQITLLA